MNELQAEIEQILRDFKTQKWDNNINVNKNAKADT